ncbi:hypothetical protein ACVWZ8_000867 [Arthrobacter sp. UYCu723]
MEAPGHRSPKWYDVFGWIKYTIAWIQYQKRLKA